MLGGSLQVLLSQGLLHLAQVVLGELWVHEAPKIVRLDGGETATSRVRAHSTLGRPGCQGPCCRPRPGKRRQKDGTLNGALGRPLRQSGLEVCVDLLTERRRGGCRLVFPPALEHRALVPGDELLQFFDTHSNIRESLHAFPHRHII
jgi:hypothetical protein